ncbi:VOC family protein [Kordiimonas laminariae]|uniref:VOC family protein n=1 Tax=Kordiimonas laminariae TaxID=2917717 RepID=UPI001FF41D85|nr:VOC family protein [Kordiimonas laminariae]MCK0069673.1 VOC family protein [Kordiimonas laminariae]
MKELTRVNHIGLRVSDLEKARSFYSKLGFEFIAGPIGPEPVAIMEHPSGININFILNANQGSKNNILMEGPQKYTGYTHVALEVTDADAVLSQLSSLDIPLSGEPHRVSTGLSFFVRDPDDNVIEFIEYTGLESLKQ